jgi:ubiquinone/menaquinone biosynthesis C-methylase UbiE
MDENSEYMEVFFDVQRGLPRQGPGSDESTLKALSLCRGLPQKPVVLDIGCGPGMQTVALAKALEGDITAVDIHKEYLDELKERVKAAGVIERVEIQVGDMNDLPFPPLTFDLIWSEGAAYIMGFENALVAWKRLTRVGGFTAMTELVWRKQDAPRQVTEFFATEYPAMTDVASILNAISGCGYEPVGHFTLPDNAWWEHYYTPLERKLPSLREKYSADKQAMSLVDSADREIEMRRRFGQWYGYEFFVVRKPRGQ